jgi:hypothetical protein
MGANGGFWTPFNAQSGSSLGGSLWFNVLGAAVGMLCAEDDTYSDDTYSDEHGQLLPETCMGALVERHLQRRASGLTGDCGLQEVGEGRHAPARPARASEGALAWVAG